MVSEQSFKEARKPIGKGRKEVTPTAIREMGYNIFLSLWKTLTLMGDS